MNVSALCIGQAAWDLCFIVDGYPAENSKTQTELFVESGGGPAANAAWLLASWDVPTALAALVGEDDYGRRVLGELQRAGVDCRLLERRSGYLTPLSGIITNRANGSRTVINRKDPVGKLTLSHDALSDLNPRLLLFDGHELEASLAAMQAFPSAITVLDAGSLRDGTRELSHRVDYLVCSQRFAAQATGEPDVSAHWQECVRRVRELNGKVAVVTLGEQGLAFDDGRERGRLPALPVKAADTTAAGDIFHGAFAYALLRHMGFGQALRLATTAAGLSVQKFGGRPSVPELAAVGKAMANE
jgi:sugar/nucleoside kinase (ribokinase family)